ncbi:YSIRK-type signal peptide-containing protein [Staphylococcus gallinarum]|uniref:triacylglycerol lipase n=1 Tax=Staphylococcus gallinarum TaxID=1293 RepID=A0A3A0VKA1_STAGA|nr:YSIRK-type signal peptide-containing protein [Staphylococcus gallinarum]RIP34718.1 YSIRK-type signal peptide-containing protein [Staphylococcus gallinarum]
MEKKQNKYSIRKFNIGASSILIGALIFLGAGTTQSVEADQQQEVSSNTYLSDESNQNNLQTVKQAKVNNENTKDLPEQKEVHNSQPTPMENNGLTKIIDTEYNNRDKVDVTKEESSEETTQGEQTKEQESQEDTEYNDRDKVDTIEELKNNSNQEETSDNLQINKVPSESDVQESNLNESNKTNMTEYDTKATQINTLTEDNQQVVSDEVDRGQRNSVISLDQLQSELQSSDNPQENSKDEESTTMLKVLKDSTVATMPKQTQQTSEPINEQPTKMAKQSQYKNDDPIILVHGFNGFTDDINPPILSHYWGGDKLNIRQDLQDNGYETYEASIGALSSNYDRAVELYYYIKGGTVDYGAAHAEKYGHERYGRTYEGVYKDWQPGQKVHLVAHSMGGQTVRQLEELLRNGNPEEINYQKEHGGEISPLYQGGHDNMVTSITTLGTPHNGTVASDELGNEAFIRQIVYDYVKFKGNTDSRSDFGLNQWGLKQQEGESYSAYVKRVKNSKLWKTQDNGLYDLSTEGAAKLNANTSLNPNIVYKTYTGESTRSTLFGRQKSDINMFLPFTVTGNIIGKTANTSWRENDGLVSVVSAQHPNNQAYIAATDEIQKGVWQVTPVRHGWDHVDFVGQDSTDPNHDSVELQQFWHGIADELVRSEQLDS